MGHPIDEEGEFEVIVDLPPTNPSYRFQLTSIVAQPLGGEPPIDAPEVEVGVTRAGFLTAIMELQEVARNTARRGQNLPPIQLVSHQPLPPGTHHRITDAANGLIEVDIVSDDFAIATVSPFNEGGYVIVPDPNQGGAMVRRRGVQTVELRHNPGQSALPILRRTPGATPPHSAIRVYEGIIVSAPLKTTVH